MLETIARDKSIRKQRYKTELKERNVKVTE
jgi:hypothetical protein